MTAAWKIRPFTVLWERRTCRIEQEASIVNAVLILVYKYDFLRRARIYDPAQFDDGNDAVKAGGAGVVANLQLLHIALALSGLGLVFGLGQGGQQERRQDGNDGDDNQQFNQGEGRYC